MINIVENPDTKELYAEIGPQQIMAFDGAPYAQTLTGWQVVGQALSAKHWMTAPGDCRTYYGAIDALVVYPDGKSDTYRLGETISWLRNWIADMERQATVSVMWLAAYSDRNVARAKSETVAK